MSHNHAHAANKTILLNSFLVISGFMFIEIAGGALTNSLALLSDAGHMFSDAAALALCLFAFKFGEKKGTIKNTFGYKRIEILAAAINGLALIAIAAWIILEAVRRFANPPQIATLGMLAVSAVGLAVNIFVAWYMHGNVRENINMRGAYLHVLSDILGSLGAITAALLMIGFGWSWADPLASLFVSLLIAKSGYDVLKAALHILMEGAPSNVRMEQILTTIKSVDEVKSVHDLHVWSITSGLNALSAHIVIKGDIRVSAAQNILRRIEHKLEHLGINHVTIQTETQTHGHSSELICDIQAENSHEHSH
ncbi:MAG: cation diffusion facilitator family transporter [Campylobacter sp.]|nr:cation diffusion facilitator family transporter [Campylobacter sp.]